MKKIFLEIIATGLFILVGCKKVEYQEDKISGDYWTVKEFTVDDFDSTAFVKYSYILGYRFEAYDLDKEDILNRWHQIYEVRTDGTETLLGHWGRREKNTMFLGNEYKIEDYGPFYPSHYHERFKIMSIKNNKMKYELKVDGKVYKIIFER